MTDDLGGELLGQDKATREARAALRELIRDDPVSGVQKVESDGVQVGEGDGHNDWDPNSFDYLNNGFKGAQVAADRVDSAEEPKPGIKVGAELLGEHREALRKLAE